MSRDRLLPAPAALAAERFNEAAMRLGLSSVKIAAPSRSSASLSRVTPRGPLARTPAMRTRAIFASVFAIEAV